MRKGIVCLLAAALLGLLPRCLAEETPVLRALIVTCDRFLSQADTTPAAQENARMMEALLGRDARGYAVIRTACDSIGTVGAFRAAVLDAFDGAEEKDVSLLYISTHGVYSPARSNLTAAMLLCDGEMEEELTPQALEGILAEVPGTHAVIMDACHSGAFIGKGLSNGPDGVPLTGVETKVLCSAGGSEDSWYWRSADTDEWHGAGYFTSVLARGCSAAAGYPADLNADGAITLREAFVWLRERYAVSTPQVYPEREDTFVLYACAEGGESAGIGAIEFEETVFSGGADRLRFSFELYTPTRLAYQLVYMKNGAWDFAGAQQLVEPDTLAAGWYERALMLHLPDEAEDVSGYLLVQFFSFEDDRPALHESRLVSVLPLAGDIALSVECAPVFRRAAWREMPVIIRHDIPCVLTVQILNARGDTVRYLAYAQQSRPQHLVPEGTCMYWDGLLADGTPAPAGDYILRVQTEVGGRVYQAYSVQFRVIAERTAG